MDCELILLVFVVPLVISIVQNEILRDAPVQNLFTPMIDADWFSGVEATLWKQLFLWPDDTAVCKAGIKLVGGDRNWVLPGQETGGVTLSHGFWTHSQDQGDTICALPQKINSL